MNWYDDKIKTNPNYLSKGKISSLDLLYPGFVFPLLKLFVQARKENLSIYVFETYRSQERQLELFNKGTSMLKKNGMHHFGIASDVVFLDGAGNPSWSGSFNWARLGAIGLSHGLEWGGNWKNFVDKPHFQLIPATFSDQAKIVAKNYPPYDSAIDGKLSKAITCFESAKAAHFSSPTITALDQALSDQAPQPKPPLFTRDLLLNSTGPDVKLLQQLLNTDNATKIAVSGVGSPGHETGYFGEMTKLAVGKFQLKHGVTTPIGPGYGRVGPKTRAKLQELFG